MCCTPGDAPMGLACACDVNARMSDLGEQSLCEGSACVFRRCGFLHVQFPISRIAAVASAMDHEVDWEPVPEPSASPFVGLDAQGARRLSSLRAPDSSTDTDDPRSGGPASDSSSDIDDGPILARRAERNSVTERRKLTFSAVFDGPQPTTDAAEPQQAYPLPPAAPPPGVVGHTPVPVGGPDHAVVEAALQALHREQETSPGGDGDEQEEAGRGLVYPDRGVEEVRAVCCVRGAACEPERRACEQVTAGTPDCVVPPVPNVTGAGGPACSGPGGC